MHSDGYNAVNFLTSYHTTLLLCDCCMHALPLHVTVALHCAPLRAMQKHHENINETFELFCHFKECNHKVMLFCLRARLHCGSRATLCAMCYVLCIMADLMMLCITLHAQHLSLLYWLVLLVVPALHCASSYLQLAAYCYCLQMCLTQQHYCQHQ